MADRTAIPVTQATWNPVTGCNPVSPGCKRCYAKGFAARLAGRYGYPKDAPFRVTVHEDRMGQPRAWKKPRTVFTCSMGDLFHKDVPDAVVERVFLAMSETKRHTYMVLTKRPERLIWWLEAAPAGMILKCLKNVWVGVSAENQECAEQRLEPLVRAWPGRRIACLEPLLERVNIRPWIKYVDWVVAGGETGPGGREADPDHVRFVRDQCMAAGTPFYFKQWGGRNNKHKENTLDGRKWEQLGAYRARGETCGA